MSASHHVYCRRHRVGVVTVVTALLAVVSAAGMTAIVTPPAAAAAQTTSRAPLTAAAPADLTPLVNPLIGTENAGLDHPVTGAPFGMVQESALVQTAAGTTSRATGCYADPANLLEGFSQSDINGCRFNYVPLMPTTGAITSVDPAKYGSRFARRDEQLHPDYSRFEIPRYHVRAELTATTRTGWQRYTFPRTRTAHVLFNTGANVTKSSIRIVGDHTIEGWVDDTHRTYFVAQVNRPFTGYGTWAGTHRHPGSRESTAPTSNGGWITFDTRTDDRPVVVKLGLSYTGIAGARRNLAGETGRLGFDFDRARATLHHRWNALLHRAAVSGGSHAQQVAYYSSLYRASLDPNVIGDVDGRYMGFDGKLRRAVGFTPYSNLSLWDTYRTQNELTEMLEPRVAHDVDMTILAIGRQDGWLPRWFLANDENNIMTGDPITPYLVEAWSKGMLTGKSATEAYALVRKNATETPPASSPMNGRAGATYFDRLGYIPYGMHVTTTAKCPHEGSDAACCPTKNNDNDCYYPGSAPLEYAAADGALALMAKGMGHAQDARTFARLGQSYHQLYDRSIGLFRPRTQTGQWLTPYDPANGDHSFHEGTPAQYQWLVPQDPAGLVSMLGGRAAASKRLDAFFGYSQVERDPARGARRAWVSRPYHYYGPSVYDPDNEPNLVAPYLYAWTGQPARTATVVHAAETLYTDSPSGITGNDDMGEMSAWYVMSALGLYPTMSGANYYVTTTPEFPHATVRIGHWTDRQGGTLEISAPGSSMRRRYIASAKVNGHAWGRDWVRQSDIAHGGTIDDTLSTTPTSWSTSAKDTPPSVDPAPFTAHELSAQLSPGAAVVQPSPTSASAQRLALTLNATAPKTATVRLTTHAPSGWTVTAPTASQRIASDGYPTQVNVPITVTAPADAAPGRHVITVVAHLAGAAAVTTRATLTTADAGTCALTRDGDCAVDLSTAYNRDGIATPGDPHAGDFGEGASYAAAQMPGQGPLTIKGVPYMAPSATGHARNFVTAEGQTLTLPAGHYRRIDLLGAANFGSTGIQGAVATVTYTDGSTATVHLGFTDWLSKHPGVGNVVARHMTHEVTKDSTASPAVSLYRTTVPLNPAKTVRAISLPKPSVALWLRPGLGNLQWERDSDLEIYAMTLQG